MELFLLKSRNKTRMPALFQNGTGSTGQNYVAIKINKRHTNQNGSNRTSLFADGTASTLKILKESTKIHRFNK
jgi:hypothetical protein